MRFLATPTVLKATFRRLIEKHDAVACSVAWASCECEPFDLLVRHADKIAKAAVGIHFYQTSPTFIRKFHKDARFRFVMNPSGVFHPKVFLFSGPGKQWSCLMGSANLTKGAFGENDEACVLLSHADIDSARFQSDCVATLERHWEKGRRLKSSEVDAYATMAARFKAKLRSVGGEYGGGARSRAPHEVDLQIWSWREYYNRVRKERGHDTEGRLKVLHEARQLFSRPGDFADLSEQDRASLAGTIAGGSAPWGWFGGMYAAGNFKRRIKQNDPELSDALSAIPLSGPVTRSDYLEFLKHYERWDGRLGLGPATRMLSMKRPDTFVCLNKANREGLSEAFGTTVYTDEYEKYWDQVIERMLDSAWWNSPRPKDSTERSVWEGRMAFLDALFYDPSIHAA